MYLKNVFVSNHEKLPFCQGTLSTVQYPLPRPGAFSHSLTYDLSHLKTNITEHYIKKMLDVHQKTSEKCFWWRYNQWKVKDQYTDLHWL